MAKFEHPNSSELREIFIERAEMLAALKAIRDQTEATQHSPETRLYDIYDIANIAIDKAESRS